MKLRSSVITILIWTLFIIASINGHKNGGGKPSKHGKGWGKNSWNKGKSRGSRWSSSEDWPCDPFSTTDDFEEDFDDFSTTTTWSNSNGNKYQNKKKKHKKKYKKKKAPCDSYDSWWSTSTTDESYDAWGTTYIPDATTTTTSTTSSIAEEETTSLTITETYSSIDGTIDCDSYSEGCNPINTGDAIPDPGVCCVYQLLATCVSCDQSDLCDESNTDIVCECYDEDECPTECVDRCIGLSQALLQNEEEAGDQAMTVASTSEVKGVMDNVVALLIAVFVILLLIVICLVSCRKRRNSKYSSMEMEDVDMHNIGGVAQSADINGEESVRSDESQDIVFPESRTNTMESANEEAALTGLITVESHDTIR